jgi:excisionase family DNA binding protein
MSADLPEDLVPLGKAATALHVNRSTIYRWVLGGKLRSWRRAGTRYLVSLADVRELLKPVEHRRRDVSAQGETERQAEARKRRTDETLRMWGL